MSFPNRHAFEIAFSFYRSSKQHDVRDKNRMSYCVMPPSDMHSLSTHHRSCHSFPQLVPDFDLTVSKMRISFGCDKLDVSSCEVIFRDFGVEIPFTIYLHHSYLALCICDNACQSQECLRPEGDSFNEGEPVIRYSCHIVVIPMIYRFLFDLS